MILWNRPLVLGVGFVAVAGTLGMDGGGWRDWAKAESAEDDVIPGEFIVHFRPAHVPTLRAEAGRFVNAEPSLAARLQAAGVTSPRPLLRIAPRRDNGPGRRLASTFVVRSDRSLPELRAQLEDQGAVESIEPLGHMRALAEPNDTWYHFQWDMAAADIATIRETHDGSGAVVAVIDSGVSPGGADGFLHLLQGYDFIGDDEDASDDDAMISGLSHGSHVAGTIAQVTDNVEGVVGLAPEAGILPVRVLHYDDASGAVWGDTDDIANGILWAVDHGAQIINMSLGSPGRSDAVADACAYAYENDVMVVASSGNDGNPAGVLYPAALPTVFAVGAHGSTNEVTPYSNGGPQVDLVAPGGEGSEDRDGDGHDDGIVQESVTENGWRYVFSEGTSMAAPHVAGAAALLLQNGWVRHQAIEEALIQSADDLYAPGHDDASGFGKLNILAALAVPVAEGLLQQEGPVTISQVSTDYSTDGRVWVSWITDIAATTEATGSDVNEYDELATHLHRVLVKGSPGFGTTIEVSSTSKDGTTASEDVELTFPLPSDNPFAGCADGAAGALFAPAAAAMAWRRRSARR
ncbi:hypothetical protein LBMAG42_32100 [Deltaproteobacteria bacterium]|nr:hypothetical protein LBMAG42_32100 [Deltaproteobacteria bacterium]